MRARSIQDRIDRTVIDAVTRFTTSLVGQYRETHWDVIGGALRRIVSLLLMAEGELPEVKETYRIVALELDIPLSGERF